MITIRATRKLLARLEMPPIPQQGPTTARLGEWHADLLYFGRAQVVMFVNDRTLLPVLVPAKDKSKLFERFADAAALVLERLGVAAEVVERERREFAQARIGKTSDRRVLGSMKEFAFMTREYWEDDTDLLNLALRLARTPCSPLELVFPDRETQRLLR